jgi:hypothetical protein
LRGLKENVIIGRLIPVGTGFHDDEQAWPEGSYLIECLSYAYYKPTNSKTSRKQE